MLNRTIIGPPLSVNVLNIFPSSTGVSCEIQYKLANDLSPLLVSNQIEYALLKAASHPISKTFGGIVLNSLETHGNFSF